MAMSPGTHRLGPQNASLVVKTYREGVAAKAGHDLVIDVESWSATFAVADDPAHNGLELQADAGSLHPRAGLGGVKPFSDRDRRDVRKNIDEKVLGAKPIRFRSSRVEATAGGLSVHGDLTLNGQTHPASFELRTAADGSIAGEAWLTQSEWGIEPYRGMMGALKVRDSLEVIFEGRLAPDRASAGLP